MYTVCVMFIQRFETRGRRFTNFHYYYYVKRVTHKMRRTLLDARHVGNTHNRQDLSSASGLPLRDRSSSALSFTMMMLKILMLLLLLLLLLVTAMMRGQINIGIIRFGHWLEGAFCGGHYVFLPFRCLWRNLWQSLWRRLPPSSSCYC